MTELTEEQAIQAIIPLLEALTGSPLADHSKPDEETRDEQAVDALLTFGDQSVAVEHTKIESFGGQIQTSKVLDGFRNELYNRIKDRLPDDGSFDLTFPAGYVPPTGGLRESVLGDLSQQIIDSAPGLDIGSGRTAPNHRAEIQLEQSSEPAVLYRWPRQRTRFSIGIRSPENESLRKDRLRRALDAKLEKLANQEADVRVLLLQSDDVALGDPYTIRDVLCALIDEGKWPVPDLIYLIEDSVELWTLMRDGKCAEFDGFEPVRI